MTAATSLEHVAPAFVEMAHRIVWCTVATVDRAGQPRTRVLHPIWEWDGANLTGWIATSPQSLKAKHLEGVPSVSLTYWADNHDTCSAECRTRWLTEPDDRRAGWDRFLNGSAPVGYDPGIIPGWESADSEAFGLLELLPTRLRVMPGSVMLEGRGSLLTWPSPS